MVEIIFYFLTNQNKLCVYALIDLFLNYYVLVHEVCHLGIAEWCPSQRCPCKSWALSKRRRQVGKGQINQQECGWENNQGKWSERECSQRSLPSPCPWIKQGWWGLIWRPLQCLHSRFTPDPQELLNIHPEHIYIKVKCMQGNSFHLTKQKTTSTAPLDATWSKWGHLTCDTSTLCHSSACSRQAAL